MPQMPAPLEINLSRSDHIPKIIIKIKPLKQLPILLTENAK